MKSASCQNAPSGVSLRQLFRPVFVLSSLYLLRGVLIQWDGFKFYAPFSEFVPSIALMAVLWTVVAFILTVFLWIVLVLLRALLRKAELKIRDEHLLLSGALTIALGLIIWKVRNIFWSQFQIDDLLKVIIVISVVCISTGVIWLFRARAGKWFSIIQERITPLVWLFGIVVLVSLPVTGYYTLRNIAAKPLPDTFAYSAAAEPDEKRPNILFITFDAMTARDMSLYGYQRETTPYIAEWAKDAVIFTKAEAGSSHTSPATASLMTGKRVWTHQVFQQRGSPVRSDIESLPGVLKDNGYFNVAFVVNPFASAKKLGILEKFDIAPLPSDFYQTDDIPVLDPYQYGFVGVMLYKLFGDKIRFHDWILDGRFLANLQPFVSPKHTIINPEYTKTAVPPDIAFNRFLKIFDSLPRPFFAWIHVFPPHDHYLPPEPYRGMFGPSFPPDFYKQYTSDVSTYDMGASDVDEQYMHNFRVLYDEFIRYCDAQFQKFMADLERKNGIKNTVIIVSADHGESFQHNVFKHSSPHLYEQLTHVPLVIRNPVRTDGMIVSELVEQIDIPATVLDLAHIPVPAWMEGRSLVPLMRGEGLPPRPAFSMFFNKNRSRGHEISKGSIAVWEGNYKLIHYLQEGESLLFNLKDDPEEMDNLIEKEPETGRHLVSLIEDNLRDANERISLQSGL